MGYFLKLIQALSLLNLALYELDLIYREGGKFGIIWLLHLQWLLHY